MTSERALYTALSAVSGLSDADGVNEGLIHAVKRYVFLVALLAVAVKLSI